MIAVTLVYINGNREQILLAGVPRTGETIHMANGAREPVLIVDGVAWTEGVGPLPNPAVLVMVRARDVS